MYGAVVDPYKFLSRNMTFPFGSSYPGGKVAYIGSAGGADRNACSTSAENTAAPSFAAQLSKYRRVDKRGVGLAKS
jgi:hypothetical protein